MCSVWYREIVPKCLVLGVLAGTGGEMKLEIDVPEISEDDFLKYVTEVTRGMAENLETRLSAGEAYLKENGNDEEALVLFDYLAKQLRRLQLVYNVLTLE